MLTRFEGLLDDYFEGELAERDGLPTVKYFADKLCLSSNYFGDMFKKETGKTPQEYIQEKVIELAKERMSDRRETVSRVAYSLGFQYPQHFCRLFKKRVGCTPNEYRAQNPSFIVFVVTSNARRHMLDLRTVYECNRCLGCKTLHPQVGIINLENPSLEEDAVKFEFYAVLLIEDCPGGCCCCGRKYYDYSNATMVFLTPGEIFRMSKENTLPDKGYLWHFILTCCSAPH